MYEVFAKLLDESNKKAADVARATEIPSSTFTDWKKGRSTPKQEKLKKIADYFGVSVEYLMTGEEKKENPYAITSKDERDIAKDMESIRTKLLNGADGPLSYDGEPIPEEDAELLLGQIELMMRRLKPINKENTTRTKIKSRW